MKKNWFVEQRMKYIAECLWVYGFINRKHLMRKFRISEPQASNDLRDYGIQFPHMMSYDTARKCYVAKAKR